MSLPPADPHAAHAAARRRASLTRSVGAVTQLTTVVALTSTGGIVGALARQAHEADALTHEQVAAPEVVVASPVARPVRTVVVRRPAVVRPAPRAQQPRARALAPREQTTVRKTRQDRSASPNRGRPAAAPRPTQSAPATKTSGS